MKILKLTNTGNVSVPLEEVMIHIGCDIRNIITQKIYEDGLLVVEKSDATFESIKSAISTTFSSVTVELLSA